MPNLDKSKHHWEPTHSASKIASHI